MTIFEGGKSQEHLRTWNGQMFDTFKKACIARGLLEDDHEWRICLKEAIAIQPGMACHQLLAVILLTDEVAEPHLLWDQFKAGLCDDVKHKLYHINHYQADQEIPEDDIYDYCKGMLQDSLDNLVWVSIIQLALRSSEPAIHSSLPSCSRYHGLYYTALLGMVVISVLIWVPVVTGTQIKLVQYIQLVIYGRIPYLNIDWNSRAIHGSFLSLSLLLMLSVIRGCY